MVTWLIEMLILFIMSINRPLNGIYQRLEVVDSLLSLVDDMDIAWAVH